MSTEPPDTRSRTTSTSTRTTLTLQNRAVLGLVVLIGILFSLAAGHLVQRQADEQLRWTLQNIGTERHLLIEREFAVVGEKLHAVRGFIHASQLITKPEFDTFARSLLERSRGLAALEWIPRVDAERMDLHEENIRVQGNPTYSVWELGTTGVRVPVAGRDEYFPVQFASPLAGNEAAIGFDLGSNPRRRTALEAARQHGELVTTAPISLVQDTLKMPSVLLLLPVYHKQDTPLPSAQRHDALLGYALAVVRVGALIEETLSSYPQDPIDILVTDTTSAGDAEEIHTHRSPASRDAGVPPTGARMTGRPRFSQEIDIGGRRWRLTSIATERLSESWFWWGPWGTLIGGLLGTFLLTGFLLTIMRQNASISAAFTRLEGEVTERKLAEEARHRLENQLRQSQKMEALGTLAGGIAHDFNNVLTGIILNAELISQANTETSPATSQAGEILVGARLAQDLVRGILTFSRQMEPSLQPADLHDALQLGARMLRRTLPKMIKIRTQLEARHTIIMGDPNQLTQMLINLGTNAKDAMAGESGHLDIDTRDLRLETDDVETGAGAGAYVELTVSDNGQGMAPEIRDRIFDPFYTQKEVGRGTGLGLSIVYGIIQGHDGYISCISAPGAGSTFRVLLPVVSDHATTVAPTALQESPVSEGGAERILVVDDEGFIVRLMRTLLEKQGYKVLTAASGEEALNLFERRPQDIDLVVLDISMPGMGGHQCFKKLLEIRKDVKILVSSGYALEGKVQDTLDLGAVAFLAKPYTNDELLATIQEILSA